MATPEQIQICKLAALAIMVDVQLTDTEIEFLDRLMDRYQLTEAERADVRGRNFDDDPAELAREIQSKTGRDELVQELTGAVRADGGFDDAEKLLVQRVLGALGLTENELTERLAQIAATSETSGSSSD
ncbi:MAG: TerB family tellurite resistance protein [Myxococcales bacterium]|nr:TerB family tellurite resistance protein [Myxococcales bacterium]